MAQQRTWLGIFVRVVLGIAILVALSLIGFRFYFGGGDQPEFWESNIAAYEQQDAERMPAPGAVLFTGSSSIRLWSSLAHDMAPYRILNRGFGGAHMSHVNYYAPRIVFPYAPSAIVVYAGDNDVGAGKSAEQVVADYNTFIELVRSSGLDVPIFYLPIKPSRLRWSIWAEQNKANAQIEKQSAGDPMLHYIDTAGPMLELAEPGEPPPNRLFLLDGLHLSDEGYALWTQAVRSTLESTIGDALPR
ncbi:MAG: GDSL-type esterase/lipase family protein [Myxococcota bacterium]|nr:GDSL-type esterase/lipase family protein [Myxococcota bacterium]